MCKMKTNPQKLLILNSKYADQNIIKINIKNMITSRFLLYEYEKMNNEKKQKNIQKIKEDLEICFDLEVAKLFMILSVEKAFEKYGEKNVVELVLKMNNYFDIYSNIKIETEVSDEELDRFIKYSYDREEDLKPCTDEMTGRKFLQLCRLCYEAGPKYPYPSYVSDFYVYVSEKGGGLHEHYHLIAEEIDIDSPKDFVQYHNIGYHTEELRFGGPCIWFKYYDDFVDGQIKTLWTANFYGKSEDDGKVIKMYLALRDKGYPITISEPEKIIYNYLSNIKLYSRYSTYGQKHYVKNVDEAIKLAEKLKNERNRNEN